MNISPYAWVLLGIGIFELWRFLMNRRLAKLSTTPKESEEEEEINLFTYGLTAQQAQQLLANGADATATNSEGLTPLMIEKDGGAILAIAAAGADISAVDIYQQNAVHHLAWNQDPRRSYTDAVLQLAHQAGLNLDAADKEGNTPVYLAVYQDADETVEALLTYGANPNTTPQEDSDINLNGETALSYAATVTEHTLITLLLLGAGAHDTKEQYRWTPLHQAAASGNEAEAAALLAQGTPADMRDILGCTPLMAACFFGHTAIAKLLVEAGAAPDTRSANKAGSICTNWSPLMLAAWKGNTDTVAYLLSLGVEVDGRGDDCGFTPLIVASRRNKIGVARLLLQAGADPNALDTEYQEFSPLYYATPGTEMHRLLLAHGATEPKGEA